MREYNNLMGVDKLSNIYFEMRHGLSVPQKNGIILSDLVEAGKEANGLVEEGREQVGVSVGVAMRDGLLDSRTVIKSSPLSRAIQSAEVTQKVLGAGIIVVEPSLRERNFGGYEGKCNRNYQSVWDMDAIDPNHKKREVESANEVQDRFSKVILETEREFRERVILLVAHGDTLQIGETCFRKLPASAHRTLRPLQNAEIRRLQLGNL